VRRHRSAAILALLLAGGGCRHVAPLPQDWQTLVAAPPSFAALYRLSCCGRGDLVLTVRVGDEKLSLTAAVPPAGTVLAAWVDADGGWLNRPKDGCRERLPKDALPLSPTSSLPLEPRLATLLLTGLLPPGARELPELPGWVEAATGEFTWRARVEGPQPHCTRVVVSRAGEQEVVVADLESPLSSSSGAPSLPRGLSLRAGSVKAKLKLQSWHTGPPPSPPPWLSAPACGASP
jgi:hypothetical protein